VSKLTCKEVILDYLSDYLDVALTPEKTAELERHLKECPPCLAYLNTYRKTRELTAQTAPAAMPEELKSHVRQFLLNQLAKGHS
jgi:anti-sigma factor (TIGR02949 family)